MKWYEWALVAGAAAVVFDLLFGDRDRSRARPTHDTAGAPRSRIRPASPPRKEPEDGGTGAGGAGPESASAGAGTPHDADAKAVRERASSLIRRQGYSDMLGLLEGVSSEILANTPIVEDLLLEMLKDVRLRHPADREFAEVVGLHEQRILGLVDTVLREVQLDAQINRSLGKYDSLVNHVSRVRLGRESKLDDPEFLPWLDGNYPHVLEFLRADASLISKTNSLVQMLSVQFRSREKPNVGAYMKAVDGLCEQAMRICDRHGVDYAKKANESWSSAKMEMAVLVAIDKHFGIRRIDPEIPNSEKLADMSFEHDGAERYVEVYSHPDHSTSATQLKTGIAPEKEWRMRFGRTQIKRLKDASVPAVYVMGLDDFQAQPGETGSQAFREEAARAMPADSDIVVVIRGEAEAASLRGGRMVDRSGIAARLEKAIRDALPENAEGARP